MSRSLALSSLSGLILSLALGNAASEILARTTLGGRSTSTADTCKLASSAARILADATLSDCEGDLAVALDAHCLHHLLDSDSVDCGTC